MDATKSRRKASERKPFIDLSNTIPSSLPSSQSSSSSLIKPQTKSSLSLPLEYLLNDNPNSNLNYNYKFTGTESNTMIILTMTRIRRRRRTKRVQVTRQTLACPLRRKRLLFRVLSLLQFTKEIYCQKKEE